uniref:DDE Tnp4 domain-containing protein n=1 Tax=Homalodisca liturata TaxID=320908 RepID=A0A1B6IGQ9_9HEMI
MAVVNANYNFIYVNTGCQGRLSDVGVFAATELAARLEEKCLDLPENIVLPNRETFNWPVPYMFLADDAFPLKLNIMKRFAGTFTRGTRERIFNGRHSRGRRVVENSFGILLVVFRVLRKPMLLQPVTAE